LKSELESLKQQNQTANSAITNLTTSIKLQKNSRKSDTSPTPSSQDFQRSNRKSLREKSIRETGGQVGHTGRTLLMSENPDKIIPHEPNYCKECGEDLSKFKMTLVVRCQELALPPIVPQYIEHRAYGCQCGRCGVENVATLAPHLKGNIQYHPNISAIIGYLSVRQFIPYNRIVEMMQNIFNLPTFSEGTVDNMLKSLAKKSVPAYQVIQTRIQHSEVVGGDETGVKINKAKGWLFTFQNEVLTFIVVAMTRGFACIEQFFKDGFPKAVYVSDCWKAQPKTPAMMHQICLVHL
jgi:transposase